MSNFSKTEYREKILTQLLIAIKKVNGLDPRPTAEEINLICQANMNLVKVDLKAEALKREQEDSKRFHENFKRNKKSRIKQNRYDRTK